MMNHRCLQTSIIRMKTPENHSGEYMSSTRTTNEPLRTPFNYVFNRFVSNQTTT